MLKTILKLIKWWFLFWVYLFLGALAAAIVGGILTWLLGLHLDMGLLTGVFTLLLIVEHVLRKRRKQKAREAGIQAEAVAAEARREAARLKNEYAAAIDGFRMELEVLAGKIKDRQTAVKVTDIAVLLRKIALEVEEDPRDRKKVRSISDHSGRMIVDLVEKYVKLERQGQTGSNIASAMWEITSALDTVKSSLETLLDDLFSNDGAEVAANVAVLESMLSGMNLDQRIRMEEQQ